jgi:ketosteroid isomerase-like protein
MPHEHTELVRRAFDEWTLGEINETEIRAVYHPDVEFLPQRRATEGAYRGIAGLEKFAADTQEVFEKFEVQYELLDLRDRVLAWGNIRARARGSGIETDFPFGGVYEFREGRIVRWEDFGSKDKALEAMGLAG